MVKKYTLCIAIPTFNRGKYLSYVISNYLKSDDNRFCITLQDNCSTDGSFELLSKITDGRIRLRQNKENIGSIPNSKEAINNNDDSEYLMFSIDKDGLDIDHLSEFIDFLEKEKPAFGIVDLYGENNVGFETYEKGYNSILNTSYLSKHPTGFFWRQDILTQEINKPYFKSSPSNFDFWFDLFTAHFASSYKGYNVHIPFILHGKRLPQESHALLKGNKSKTYNASNYYFGVSKRIETFRIYLSDTFNLQLSDKDKENLSLILLNRTMRQVSVSLRQILHSNWEAYHYNFEWRIMPLSEMVSNINKVMAKYKKYMSDKGCYSDWNTRKIWGRCILSSVKLCLREFIKRPQNIPYKA